MTVWRKHIAAKTKSADGSLLDLPAGRAIELLDSGRPGEARAAIAGEPTLAPDTSLIYAILRACTASALNEREELQKQLRLVLAVPLVKVECLSFQDLSRLFERLWNTAARLPDDDALRSNLIDRMLAAGLAADKFFEPYRALNDLVEHVTHYRCVLHQPLDRDWPLFQGCLLGQETWESYEAPWGVLARDEEEAAQFVLNWQSQCYPLDAVFKSCYAETGEYTERVGVVSQGKRWHEAQTADERE